MRSLLTTLTFCGLLSCSAGCTSLNSMQGMVSRTAAYLKPTSADDWDPGSETSDPWIQKAGAEARGNRPVEHEPDPLGLKQIFMSNKARDIERNMGIE